MRAVGLHSVTMIGEVIPPGSETLSEGIGARAGGRSGRCAGSPWGGQPLEIGSVAGGVGVSGGVRAGCKVDHLYLNFIVMFRLQICSFLPFMMKKNIHIFLRLCLYF